MPIVRAQSVQLSRPLVHHLLGLASVQAHTVLGPVRMYMRGIELSQARQFFDVLAETVVRVQGNDAEGRVGQHHEVAQPELEEAPPSQVHSSESPMQMGASSGVGTALSREPALPEDPALPQAPETAEGSPPETGAPTGAETK